VVSLRPRGPTFFTLALILVVAVGMLVLFGSTLYTDWLWFGTLGFSSVFAIGIIWRLAVGIVSGLLLAFFIWINLSIALAGRIGAMPGIIELPIGPMIAPRRIRTFLMWGSLVIGAFIGLNVAGQWLAVLRYLNQVPFGVADPIFGRDVGFYIFSLPVLSLLYQYVMTGLVVAGIGVLLIYVLTGDLSFDVRRLRLTSRARGHVSLLTVGIFAAKAIGYRVTLYRLLYSPRGQVFGASYTDVHAQTVALRLLIYITLALAVLLVANLRLRRTNIIVAGVALLIGVSIILGNLYPTFVQQFTVEPDELNKESTYIGYNIQNTREAFDLDAIAEVDYALSGELTAADLTANAGTIKNIRLWDYRPLQATYAQLQEIRPYYRIQDVDIDRYLFGDDYRQVALAARELDQNRLSEPTWVNKHLIYTHGYGMVLNPVNRVGPEGLPELWVRDIPPRISSDAAGFELTRPQIYYGELTNDYVIVNSKQPEFDYPVAEIGATNHYDGPGGVRLSSPLVKLAFAVRLRHYQIFLANVVTPQTRLMMYRNIAQRARRIAPFLTYDRDPYLVADQGELFWIMDAYTVNGGYPYSEPLASMGGNYVRNSVKVVIGAYTGQVTFYLFDPDDALAATYAKVFPTLFRPASEMPEGLRDHIRYPQDLFSWQAERYLTYHMLDPVVFYNKEDVWTVPQEQYEGRTQPVEPYYLIMRLPGEEEPEFVLLMPLTPVGKNVMVAWLAARSDGPAYGTQTVYKFPKQQTVYGPTLIESRIDQDTEISRDLTLWGQQGSQVIRGNLLVIPIDGSILYVEPLYIQAQATKLPELKRVIVAYKDRVVMAETLQQGLNRLFGEEQGPGTGDQTMAELIARANSLFEQAQTAQRAGDWAAYGRLQDELQQVLQELRTRMASQ
jgi:hypothetical protein